MDDERAPFVHRFWWVLLAACVLLGFVARAWNLDFDRGQHLHPDERHWALTSAELERQPQPEPHGTFAGPVLDWLDGDRSPANPYRATESFVYGPVMLAAARTTAGWMHDGVVHGDQPAAAVVDVIDAIGIPLVADDGTPTFDAGYDVELVGRLLAALLDSLTIVVVGLIGRRLDGDAVGLVAAGFYASCVLAIQHAHFLGSEPLLGLCSALTVLAALHLDRSERIPEAARGGLVLGLAAGAAVAAKLNGAALVAVPGIGCVALVVMHRRRSDVVRLVAALLGGAIAFRVLHPAAFDGLGLSLSDPFLDDIARVRAQRDLDIPPAIQWADRTPIVQPLVWLVRFTVGPGIAIAATLGAIALIRRWRRASARWPIALVLGSIAAPFAYVSLAALPAGRYYIPSLPALCAVAGVGVVATWRWSSRAGDLPRIAARTVVGAAVGLAALWGVAFVNGVYGGTHTRIAASEWIVEHVEPGSVLSSQAWDDGLPLALPGIDLGAYRSEQLVMVGTDSEEKVNTVARQLLGIDYVVESSPRLWGTVGRIPARFPSTIKFFEALDTGELGFERVATFDADPGLGWFSLDDASAEEAFAVYDHPEVRIWKKVRAVDYLDLVGVLDPVAASNALPVTVPDAHANGLLLTEAESTALADGPTYDEAFDLGGPSWAHVIGWFLLLELLGLAAFVLFLPLFRTLPDAGLGIAKTLGLATPALGLFVVNTWLGVPLTRPVVVVLTITMVAGALALAQQRRSALFGLWTTRRRLLITVEAVGFVVFVALVALRAANPDLWHPFRGGEKPFESALLTVVLRTESLPPYDAWFSDGVLNYYYGGYLMLLAPARVLATSPALIMNIGPAVFASCAAGAASSLGAAAMVGRGGDRSPRRVALAGVASAFAVVALGNMAVFRQVVRRDAGAPFDWWSLSRVIPDTTAITEFPAWSLLFADLHPHLMDICLVLAVGVVALALYRHLVDGTAWASLATAAMAGALVGLVRATNTWDFPLVVGVTALVVVVAGFGGASVRRCVATGLVAVVMVVVVWSPYTRRGLVFDDGVDRAVEHTPWWSWLEQFGLFVAVTLTIVVPIVMRVVRESHIMWWRIRFAHVVAADIVIIGATVMLLRPASVVGVTAAALAGLTAWAAWDARNRPAGTPVTAAVLVAIGWVIQAGVELVTVRNDIGRQNTVFKFWYQSWILLAVGSAVVIAAGLPGWRRTVRGPRALRATEGIAMGVAGIALVAAASFWWSAVPARLDDRISHGGASLDGEAYLVPELEVAMYDDQIRPADDLPLIDWLRTNVRGIRTVAEAPGEDYRWSGRVSWMTGLPSPIGWQFHERQQRRAYESAIDRRVADLRELYTTSDPVVIARILADHGIDIVVFGSVERSLSSQESATALRIMPCLAIEHRSGDLFVASVDRGCVSEMRPRG